ncbi:MAG: EAL domain-containing protein [Sedimenticola sp.]|nr:EAL domain-containing protein [Sedimenticola sp.]
MLVIFFMHIALFAAFPFYFARLKKPLRPIAFYVYLGLLLAFGGFFGSVYSIPITDAINISGGNLLYGAFIMTSILFVIIERDLFILRNTVRLVITVNVFKILLFYLVSILLVSEDIVNPYQTQVNLFKVSIPFTILGGALIVSELLFLFYVFEKLKKRTNSTPLLSLSYVVLFIFILCIDGILFPTIAFGFSEKLIGIVIGGVKGKLIMALAYCIPIVLFMMVYKNRFLKYLTHPPFSWRLLVTSSEKLTRDLREKDRGLRRAAVVYENSREGILVTDPSFKILSTNKAYARLTGYSEQEMLSRVKNIATAMHFDKRVFSEINDLIQQDKYWEGEVTFSHRLGKEHSGILSIGPVESYSGRVVNYVCTLTDITEIKKTQEQLEYLAHHDSLTGLPNRRVLNERLERNIKSAQRAGTKLGLLLIDLDRFKDVNDSFGHQAGDDLLKQIAARLQKRIRGVDTLCRMGGDEFALLLEKISDFSGAAHLAAEIVASLSGSWKLSNGSQVHVGASIGISIYPEHGDTASVLLQRADAALYKTKSNRRGSYQFFTDDMTNLARNRIELEAKLRKCIQQDYLDVYFQPQIDISTGKIIGAEALVRWIDPKEGVISPDVFIPLAEETGLIEQIGIIVLKKSCIQGRQWLDEGMEKILITVNLSPFQLRHGNIRETVTSVLNETGYPANCLELELTESALMEREDQVVPILEELRTMGVGLAIDDFGTGYSSLAYLKRFPIDTLKIDKSFIDDIPDSKDNMELTTAIISMGQNLRFRIVAEGVETKGQLEFLASKGCDCYQGYLKSPPVPAAQFKALFGGQEPGNATVTYIPTN